MAQRPVAPARPLDRHRPAPPAAELNRILSREQRRTVQGDWTVSYRGRALQILRQEGQPCPRERVTVRECFDGTLEILHRGKALAWRKTVSSKKRTRSVGLPPWGQAN